MQTIKLMRPITTFIRLTHQSQGLALWLLTSFQIALLFMVLSASAEAAEPCGEPSFDGATDTAVFLWQDCSSGVWQTRFTAGNGFTRYSGTVSADQPLSTISLISIESTDSVDYTSDPATISYTVQMSPPWLDGFDFSYPSGANVCFTIITPTNATVLVGPNRVAAPLEFNPYTLGPCGSTAQSTLSIADVSAPEGAGIINFTVSLLPASTDAVTVNYQTSDNDATSGLDYEPVAGTLLFNAGETSRQVSVTIHDDALYEDDESFTVTLSDEINAFLGDADATCTILDDEVCPSCHTLSCPPEPENTYNIVVILTDDQRWDTNWAMPTMLDRIASRGITFNNAFITTPVCSSARANFLAGGFYSQNTGGLKNRLGPDPTPPFNGEVEKFKDDDTLPVALQQAGYRTLMVGKYLNGYPRIAPYVPPGWTRWVGNISGSGSNWHNGFRYAIGSSDEQSSMGTSTGPVNQYITDYQRDEILDFIDASGNTPFFVLFSTEAPHYPATPASGDESLFPDYEYRGRGYGETDLSDKPEWVAGPNAILFAQDEYRWDPAGNDEFYRNQLRSLQAVDRAIGDIVDRIEAAGKLDNTVFIFSSDNGFNWGEHGLHEKLMPYEESIRVPLVIAMPGITPREEDHMVAVDLDIPATILELAGVNKPSDGTSLLDLINDPNTSWNDEVMLQSWGYRTGVFGVWASLRNNRWKFVDYPTGEQELYDLLNDPYELESQHDNPAYDTIRNAMKSQLDADKGIAIANYYLPKATVGQSYNAQVQRWGGQGPFKWTAVGNTLAIACSARRSVLTPFELQNIPLCDIGQPTYNPGTEENIIVWKDSAQSWHLRVMAGGGSRRYIGKLVANSPYSSVTNVLLESGDSINSSDPKIIEFDLNVSADDEDGVDFTIPAGGFVSLVVEESLPSGLSLGSTSGSISGIPLQSGDYSLNVMIEGTAIATQTGLPQRYIVPYTLEVAP